MHSYGSERVVELLKKVAKKTKSPVAKELVEDNAFDDACSVAHQLFYETMEEFKEGEMTWEEAIKDLYENLKAVDMPKPPEEKEKE